MIYCASGYVLLVKLIQRPSIDGGFDACGSPLQNTDFIVALGPVHWVGGSHCRQTVNVQYT
jgi:hypothetical protein